MHNGRSRFDFGERGDDAQVYAGPKGFTVSRLDLDAGISMHEATGQGTEVVFVHTGRVKLLLPAVVLSLGRGDTMTVPAGLRRSYATGGRAIAFAVRRS